jgi:hypothetical protein
VKRGLSATAGVVAEAEPLGERCRLPRVLQGWVGLRSQCPAPAPSEGMGSRALQMPAYRCLQVRLQSGLTNYMMLGVFGGLCALLRDGCKSGFGMHEGIQSDA